ncbi:DUF3164 family protein [Mucilaginibacter sp.]|uniref:DUF3164 family protein n=1 Tax=Mucilaginibacter sp. TaxID=1882438 RepID=UPI003262E722
MSTLTFNQQKPADKKWLDEQGNVIPYDRTTPYERKAESNISKLAKEAIAINAKLNIFKAFIDETAEMLYQEFVKTNNGLQGKGKGNVTLYNFDRSIKLEVSVSEPIRFDEEYIKLAKAELDDVLRNALKDAETWVKGIITDAFEKKRGELDTDKVLALKKHAFRVPEHIKPQYDKAMDFIDKAINRPTSKKYHRVWVRGTDGQYKSVQLNFSSI